MPGVLPKVDNLLSVDIHRPHIICVVESWLSDEINDNEIYLSRAFKFFVMIEIVMVVVCSYYMYL